MEGLCWEEIKIERTVEVVIGVLFVLYRIPWRWSI